MIKKKTALAVLVLVLATIAITRPAQTRSEQLQPACPGDSYNIGTKDGVTPICKAQPTGCQYGDSIPMDMCDKFDPQPTAEPVVKSAQVEVQYGGK